MILSLSNLSEYAATWWLGASEITLIVSAVILTFGLVGEWPDSESWKRHTLYKLAKFAVVLGVVGELIGDAGIFETSARLSVLQNAAIEQAKSKAANAEERAGSANERAAKLERENLEIREKVAGRRISKEQHDEIVKLLSPEPATFDLEAMQESETGLFASDILKTLTDAGWTLHQKLLPMGVIWTNLNIFLTDDPAAGRLAAAFQAAGIAFGIGNEKRDRVTVMVGGKPSPF
jgi:hypothetical protein